MCYFFSFFNRFVLDLSCHVCTCSQTEVMMKKSSMKTAPTGRRPPTAIVKSGDMYHACSGIWRGISFVRTGGSCSRRFKPMNSFMKTSGSEMQNHIESSAKSVVKGTAPEDFSPQMKRLRMKKMRALTKKPPGGIIYTSPMTQDFCWTA